MGTLWASREAGHRANQKEEVTQKPRQAWHIIQQAGAVLRTFL